MGWNFVEESSGRSYWRYTGTPSDYTLSPSQAGSSPLIGTEQDKFTWKDTGASVSPVLSDDDGGAFDIGYTSTPQGVAPEDVFHMGAVAFRGGWLAGSAWPKLGAIGGRLHVYRGRRLVCTIRCDVSGKDMVTALLKNVNHYAKGYDVRYMSNSQGRVATVDTWLPDVVEAAIWDANDAINRAMLNTGDSSWEIQDEWLTAFGGDGFDWNSPRDWAEAGLRTLGLFGGIPSRGK